MASKQSSSSVPLRLFVVSLGCPKNLVDTERYLASIKKALGRAIALAEHQEEADLILVNTCAFIEPAVSESIESILELASKKGEDQLLAAAGCLVWRYGPQLEKLLPEVDLFYHGRDPEGFGQALSKSLLKQAVKEQPFSGTGRILVTRPWQRYVKIAEGCSNRCTYCLIPKIRGPLKCRSLESIAAEIKGLEELGAKEITLVAQDVTAYKWGDTGLVGLLEYILERSTVPWIRLLYLYPERLTPDLIELAASEPRICPYFDIPIQHASRRVLRRMGRPYGLDFIKCQVELIRRHIPDAAIRTTLITGFPGEKEDDFHMVLKAVKELEFDHLGCFVYWDEEGCAASRLPEKVERAVAEARKEEIMEFQAEISAERNKRFLGMELDVLVDGFSQETDLLLAGRSRYQAPEIDGQVYITSGTGVPGEFSKVRITETYEYDLVGEIVPE